jgi:F-type H+-transporting ATPase subunit b
MSRSLRLTALLTALLASPAHGQEDGGLLSINTGLMVWTVLIFLIVLLVLYKAAFPHILGAVEAREERIRMMLADAERDREEAAALLATQKKEIEESRARAHELLNEGREAGERLREDVLAQARREADDLVERANREIRAQVERAMEEVRREAVDLAIAAASQLVERDLDEEGNRELVRDFIARVDAPAGATAGVGA